MTGTATRYAIPTLVGSDRVNQTPQWTADVATKLATIMDGGAVTPTFGAGWRQYNNPPTVYQVRVEIDSAARRCHVVGFAEHQGGGLTLGTTLVPVWSLPGSPSLNPVGSVTGMTWGTGGWVRWIVEPGGTAGPTLSIMSPGASFGAQHPYDAQGIVSMASITWRYP
jgi:hypothetical protein